MNILISVNKAYLDKAEVMLGSLSRNTEEQIDVYLLNRSLTYKEIQSFKGHLEKIGRINLVVIKISSDIIDNLPILSHFSVEMYYRIIAQFILPKNMDRILWLDADIIVKGDITSFYYQSFDDAYMVVCPDINNESNLIKNTKKKLGLPEEYLYFNSGVLLMNLSHLRKYTDEKQIIDCAIELKEKLTYPDQDILNYLYGSKVKYDDLYIYNYQTFQMPNIDKQQIKKVKILHYISNRKPWSWKYSGNHARFWWREANKNRCQVFKTVLHYAMAFPYKLVYIFYMKFTKNQ